MCNIEWVMNTNEFASTVNQAVKAKGAAGILRQTSTEQKNNFLDILASLLEKNIEKILSENQKDLDTVGDITAAMKHRLTLNKNIIL